MTKAKRPRTHGVDVLKFLAKKAAGSRWTDVAKKFGGSTATFQLKKLSQSRKIRKDKSTGLWFSR